MTSKTDTKEEPKKSEATTKSDNLTLEPSVPAAPPFPFPSEHVPTFIIQDEPFVMNVNAHLAFIQHDADGFKFRHPDGPYQFRRIAVVAKLFGVTEPIYQNVSAVNQVQIWLQPDFSSPAQVRFDNRSGDLIVTVDQDLMVTGPVTADPDLPDRFTHTRPAGGSTIERVLIIDDQNREVFQNLRAREYNIIFFKAHP